MCCKINPGVFPRYSMLRHSTAQKTTQRREGGVYVTCMSSFGLSAVRNFMQCIIDIEDIFLLTRKVQVYVIVIRTGAAKQSRSVCPQFIGVVISG